MYDSCVATPKYLYHTLPLLCHSLSCLLTRRPLRFISSLHPVEQPTGRQERAEGESPSGKHLILSPEACGTAAAVVNQIESMETKAEPGRVFPQHPIPPDRGGAWMHERCSSLMDHQIDHGLRLASGSLSSSCGRDEAAGAEGCQQGLRGSDCNSEEEGGSSAFGSGCRGHAGVEDEGSPQVRGGDAREKGKQEGGGRHTGADGGKGCLDDSRPSTLAEASMVAADGAGRATEERRRHSVEVGVAERGRALRSANGMANPDRPPTAEGSPCGPRQKQSRSDGLGPGS